jgi:D-sedoheptulose 7-phosphate isomerase
MSVFDFDPIAEEYIARHLTFFSALPTRTIGQVADALWGAYQHNAMVFLCGNSGYATLAEHLAIDLTQATIQPNGSGRAPRLRALALTSSASQLTTWARNAGYEHIFAEQLRTLAQPGDVLLAFSGSGNTPNIIAAVAAAAELELTTVGLTGQAGGRLRSDCDFCICVDSASPEHTQPLHLAVGHLLSLALRQRIGAARQVNEG